MPEVALVQARALAVAVTVATEAEKRSVIPRPERVYST